MHGSVVPGAEATWPTGTALLAGAVPPGGAGLVSAAGAEAGYAGAAGPAVVGIRPASTALLTEAVPAAGVGAAPVRGGCGPADAGPAGAGRSREPAAGSSDASRRAAVSWLARAAIAVMASRSCRDLAVSGVAAAPGGGAGWSAACSPLPVPAGRRSADTEHAVAREACPAPRARPWSAPGTRPRGCPPGAGPGTCRVRRAGAARRGTGPASWAERWQSAPTRVPVAASRADGWRRVAVGKPLRGRFRQRHRGDGGVGSGSNRLASRSASASSDTTIRTGSVISMSGAPSGARSASRAAIRPGSAASTWSTRCRGCGPQLQPPCRTTWTVHRRTTMSAVAIIAIAGTARRPGTGPARTRTSSMFRLAANRALLKTGVVPGPTVTGDRMVGGRLGDVTC